jgi:methyl-accepting chemotaxis protein
MKLRLSIARMILVFGALTVAGFASVIMIGQYALKELKVGGPLYAQIKLGNDLVADILPPPEYVIEAYLEATLALRDPSTLGARRERLAQLHKDYDERHDYWMKSDLEPALKARLVEQSHKEVQQFWRLTESGLLPALAAADTARADRSYAALSSAYAAHRTIIDDIVKRANDDNASLESTAASRNSTISIAVWTVSGVVWLIITLGLLGVVVGVVRPIGRMTSAMRSLAEGNLHIAVPSLGRHDEIGAMAQTLQVFQSGAIENARLREEAQRAVAHTARARVEAMAEMARTVEQETGSPVEAVSAATRDVDQAIGSVAELATELSVESQSVAAASAQALGNAQAVSSAAEQLAASIREIATQVDRAGQATRSAVESSDAARTAMTALSTVVTKVAEVTSLIGGIAGQTNLLALNATIEAARAGDAGRGFAVVASEVKALSQQTAGFTDEISRLIAEIQQATQSGVDAVGVIGSKIADVDHVANAIAAAMEEQGAATQEIARNVDQSAESAKEVSSRIAGVNRGADTVKARAGEVRATIAAVRKDVTDLQAVLVRVVRNAAAA